MNDCAKYRDALSAYADGELGSDEAAELENHIAQCEECAALLDEYRDISALFSADEEPPADLVANVMADVKKAKRAKTAAFITKRVLPVAACAVLVVGAVRLLPRMNSENAMSFDTTTAAEAVTGDAPSAEGETPIYVMSDKSETYSYDPQNANGGGPERLQNFAADDDCVVDEADEEIFDEPSSDAACDEPADGASAVNAEAVVYVRGVDDDTFAETFTKEAGFPEEFISADLVYDAASDSWSAVIPAECLEPLLAALDSADIDTVVDKYSPGSGNIIVALMP